MPNKEHDASSGATVSLCRLLSLFVFPSLALSLNPARHRTSAAAFLSVFRQTALQLLLLYSPPGSDLSRAQLGGKLLAAGRDREVLLLGFLHFLLLFGLKEMIVGVPGSGPWVMLPDGNLLLRPLGADGSHFSPHGLLLCLLCA